MTVDRFLSRREASAYIEEKGFPCKASTLGRYASTGEGPAMMYFGREPRYRPQDIDAWIASRLSGPHRRASDLNMTTPEDRCAAA